ncbi:MAG: LuxR C-terminal-related transcriptional regulator [Sediminibacterium sp.]|nr:LuxR C-terminal-related transcriptional regulator [Sediminibacterium sp.]
MTEHNHIQEVFFKYLSKIKLDEKNLNYSAINKHTSVLQTLSDIGNSGTGIFDLSKREFIFYSSNFGVLLGYEPGDYKDLGQQFFASKIHPDDAIKCSINGVSVLKILNNFSSDEKFNYKLITEYRMLNSQNQYVRLIEQYQVLELDTFDQIWLMLNVVDVSSNQDVFEESKSQLLNFRTGKIIPIEASSKVQVELTRREIEILKYVKDGLLSKEISNKLAISVHTVNTHRQRFLEKLGAKNSLEAVIFAAKFGLLD